MRTAEIQALKNEGHIVFAEAAEKWVLDERGALWGPPGTWTIPPPEFKEKYPRMIALVCCPNCNTPSVLIEPHAQIDPVGKLNVFACPKCNIRRDVVYLDRWNHKSLWACMVEVWNGKQWKGEIRYVHANSEREARFQLGSGMFRVNMCAPAIGFLATDTHGEELVADATKLS